MKIRQSITPFIFGSICSGLLVLFWVLGSFGIIEVTGSEGPFWNIFIILSSFFFLIMIFFVFYRPDIIVFSEDEVIIRSIALLPWKVSLPKDTVKKLSR